MAQPQFILQALTDATHAEAIGALLQLPDPTHVLISVAFVQDLGVAAVEDSIRPHADSVDVYIGIRNGITSIQAVQRLLRMNLRVYAVDTASRSVIFHPKLCLARNADMANVLIGSANLTWAGLHNNIEASAFMRLDLANDQDRTFIESIIDSFSVMLNDHPRHVFQITDINHAEDLLQSGRLTDEGMQRASASDERPTGGDRDDLPPMSLRRVSHPEVTIPRSRIERAPSSPDGQPPLGFPPAAGAPVPKFHLVWKSNPLTERDLNIPSHPETNPTGSMGWKKGAVEDIDQRHYFREEVFADLSWIPDASPSVWERAEAKFELVIKSLNYGVFHLRLSHNTDKTSATYLQNNFMTQIHWGEATVHIAKHDLLGRSLFLYRKASSPPEFLIEID